MVEDSDWTLEELVAEGFAPGIIEALRCLTHAEEEPYDRYIARIKGNPLAVAVKLREEKRTDGPTRRIRQRKVAH